MWDTRAAKITLSLVEIRADRPAILRRKRPSIERDPSQSRGFPACEYLYRSFTSKIALSVIDRSHIRLYVYASAIILHNTHTSPTRETGRAFYSSQSNATRLDFYPKYATFPLIGFSISNSISLFYLENYRRLGAALSAKKSIGHRRKVDIRLI